MPSVTLLGGFVSVDGQPVRGVVDYSVAGGWAIVTEKDERGRVIPNGLDEVGTRRIHGVIEVCR